MSEVFPARWWEPGRAPRERADQATPWWAEYSEGAISQARTTEIPSDWRRAFASVFSPLIMLARDEFEEALRSVAHLDARRLSADFVAYLDTTCCTIAVRTLVRELHEDRKAGLLSGQSPADRFTDFVRRSATPAGLTRLFVKYPVLARLLAQAVRQTTDAHVELVHRFVEDRAAIEATLVDGELGVLEHLTSGHGDTHQRGRAVQILRFSSGQRVVYKPRPLDLHTWFSDVIRWLGERTPLRLQTVDAVARDGYGWLRFVAPQPCTSLDEVDRFYQRQGMLLALLHAFDGTDVHFENVIACGEHPVLIDLETVLHPSLPTDETDGDPAAAALSRSVPRTSLLPRMFADEHGVLDISGLGGDGGKRSPASQVVWVEAGTDRMRLSRLPGSFPGGVNQPVFVGHDIEPSDYAAAIQAGFRAGYDALTGYVPACPDVAMRVVVRPTMVYARLLDETTHPSLLRDAADRDKAFDVLRADAVRQRVASAEIADLWAGDIPLFTGRARSCDLWTSTGDRITGVLTSAPLTETTRKIQAMGVADRYDQEWLIRATLATRTGQVVHSSPTVAPCTPVPAEPARFVAAACGIGDQIVASAFVDGHRANWLGLEVIDDLYWSVLPMGAGLGDGYTGVALFLAQLAELTGIQRYRDIASQALVGIPRLTELLLGDPGLAAAAGPGGFLGLGGVAYALARLTFLLDEPDLIDMADRIVHAMPGPEGGTAGITALRSVAALIGLTSAEELADTYAEHAVKDDVGCGFTGGSAPLLDMSLCHGELGALDHMSTMESSHRAGMLLSRIERDGPRCGTPNNVPSPGMLTGLSGIGYGLLRLAHPRAVPSVLRLSPGNPYQREEIDAHRQHNP